jgi:hypothetical protein
MKVKLEAIISGDNQTFDEITTMNQKCTSSAGELSVMERKGVGGVGSSSKNFAASS